MPQTGKQAKLIWNLREGEIIVGKIKALKMRKPKESAVGINYPNEVTAAKIKLDNFASEQRLGHCGIDESQRRKQWVELIG
nr:hypothetical protein Itr_chr05CG21570 [Ipomoea trifida]